VLISRNLARAINEQIGNEFGAHMQYLSIAAHFRQRQMYPAVEVVLRAGRRRETARDEVHPVSARHQSGAADSGNPGAETGLCVGGGSDRAALSWEQEVTKQITALMEIAVKDNDYMSQSFLQWFIDEQLEEVVKMDRLLSVIRASGEKNLLMVEAYLEHIEKAH
jgi:ferritin